MTVDEYPTPSVCQLMDCSGCLPDTVYDKENSVKREYRDVKVGQWDLAEMKEME